jgi:hypothetical protein
MADTLNWLLREEVIKIDTLDYQRSRLAAFPHADGLKAIINRRLRRSLEHAVSHNYHTSPLWIHDERGTFLIGKYLQFMCDAYSVSTQCDTPKPIGQCCWK